MRWSTIFLMLAVVALLVVAFREAAVFDGLSLLALVLFGFGGAFWLVERRVSR